MFTGLIAELGVVASIERAAGALDVLLESRFEALELGESIAVDGACLTVAHHEASAFTLNVSPETLACTHFDALREGQTVHLERALAVGARLGGHFVTGHIDGTAYLSSVEQKRDYHELQVRIPGHLMPHMVPKGSVALDGVSLTVNRVVGDQIAIIVVPHTALHTHLLERPFPREMNLETDLLAKYVTQLAVNPTHREQLP